MTAIRGFLVLVGGFLTHLTLGTGFSYGNMSPYITSYLHAHNDHPVITTRDAIWGFAMVMFGQGSLMFVGGMLHMKLGPRVTSYIGCFFASLGVALTYCTIQSSLTAVVATYGLLFGLGISIAYVPSLAAAMEWFPQCKGVVNGIVVGGFGLGSFIFTQIQTGYLNPENTAPDSEGYFVDPYVLARIPNVFLLLSAIYATLQFIGCAFLTRPPKAEQEEIPLFDSPSVSVLSVSKSPNLSAAGEHSYGAVQDTKLGVDDDVKKLPPSDKTEQTENYPGRQYTPREMLRCRQFYILWFTFFFNNEILIYVNSMYKAYGQTFISDDRFLALVGAIAAIFNSCGRIIWGFLVDRSSYRTCMLVITVSLAVLTGTLGFTPLGGKAMFAAWIWIIYFFASGTFVLMPTCTTLIFGMKHASINYGVLFTNTIISAPLVALLTQNLSALIGWFGTFGMLAGFAVCSFVITLFFKDIEKK